MGVGLIIAGSAWICTAHLPVALVIAVIAIALGFLKAHFILDRSARRVTDRIEHRDDRRCIGGFLSWRTWLLVLAMILVGRLLRASPLSVPIRGVIYAAIGVALLTASRLLWARWRVTRAVGNGPRDTP